MFNFDKKWIYENFIVFSIGFGSGVAFLCLIIFPLYKEGIRNTERKYDAFIATLKNEYESELNKLKSSSSDSVNINQIKNEYEKQIRDLRSQLGKTDNTSLTGYQSQIEELKARNKKLESKISGLDTKPTPASIVEPKVLNGVTFDLQRCEFSGNSITCYMSITSHDQDIYLEISPSYSRIFDNSGNEYGVSRVEFGSKSANRGRSISNDLIKGIATQTIFYIDKVSSDTTWIPRFDFYCRIGKNRNRSTIEFRDIPFSQNKP